MLASSSYIRGRNVSAMDRRQRACGGVECRTVSPADEVRFVFASTSSAAPGCGIGISAGVVGVVHGGEGMGEGVKVGGRWRGIGPLSIIGLL